MSDFLILLLCAEEQPSRKRTDHQAAERGAETRGGQVGAAEETSTEPNSEGHSAKGKRYVSPTATVSRT